MGVAAVVAEPEPEPELEPEPEPEGGDQPGTPLESEEEAAEEPVEDEDGLEPKKRRGFKAWMGRRVKSADT